MKRKRSNDKIKSKRKSKMQRVFLNSSNKKVFYLKKRLDEMESKVKKLKYKEKVTKSKLEGEYLVELNYKCHKIVEKYELILFHQEQEFKRQITLLTSSTIADNMYS